MAMECVICKRGMAEGVSLFRINTTGVGIKGLWACAKHRSQTDALVDPELDELVRIIEGGKP